MTVTGGRVFPTTIVVTPNTALAFKNSCSISPMSGQLITGASASIQIAGQVPRPQGSFARISKKPYVQLLWPFVTSRADV